MDTIIFSLILGTLLAMWIRKLWLIRAFFFVSLLATMLLFLHHISSKLNLNF